VVIQCRRFGKSNVVGVESVRAFWATVNDVDATRGLIATTSRLTTGARAYCEARRYRLNAAEAVNVMEWLQRMGSRWSVAG
jgi:restriction endonuclease Mrr